MPQIPRGQRFLTIYSGVLTVILTVFAIAGFASPRQTKFDQIDVQRINVVEPDGTLRMVLSNRAKLPGVLVHGKEKALDRPQAGIIFLNDEASEIGGLIFGGKRNAKGEVADSGGSLSFDRYEANQIVQLIGVDDHEDRMAGLVVSDSPSGSDVRRRIWLGRGDDGVATLALMDANGKKRLLLQVAADGTPKFSLLDANGKIEKELLPAKP